ncbi:hypothetical protein PIB30_073664 [Stylosanthes scabra]|uniref:Inositol-tetrakisphosphate 1-kinase N-terminal domain-containing protein n=1 Tax=Stylosanthes scabra TaxID=79078 RepID=A0ABU6XPQ8_9FABA|nr:hypothetical protein [Stylosanthes scabra]
MTAVAATLQLHDGLRDKEGDGEFRMMFWLAGFKYTLLLGQLSSILGLENSGALFRGGGEVPKKLESFSIEHAKQRLKVSSISISGGKYSVDTMSTDHRLLHYMLTYVWLPRKGNHGAIIEDDLIILWAMVKRIRLNWPYLIAWHLMDYTTRRSVNTGLGHGVLWTKIFERFGIDLSGEEAIFVDDGSAITFRHLNKMGRGPKVAVEENVEADEEASLTTFALPPTTSPASPHRRPLRLTAGSYHRFGPGLLCHRIAASKFLTLLHVQFLDPAKLQPDCFPLFVAVLHLHQEVDRFNDLPKKLKQKGCSGSWKVGNTGIHFVAIDQNRPFSEQGPFDIVLHKLSCKEWRQVLEVKKGEHLYRFGNPIKQS